MRTSRLCLATLLAACISVATSHNHHTRQSAPSFCGLEPESGFCNGYETRYYYNVQAGTCLRFKYRGCGGNLNNFNDVDACMNVCKHYTENDKKEEAKGGHPAIKVVEEVKDDTSEVDPAKHSITDQDDWSTLQEMMSMDNMKTTEVEQVGAEEEEEEEKDVEQQRPSMDVVKEVEDDTEDVDIDRLHINDANDKATLEQLMSQDNMNVQEVVPVEEEAEKETTMSEPLPAKILRTEESDEDADLSSLHGDANDIATLEQLMAQDNFPVSEMKVVEEDVQEDSKEGPTIKVVETITDDSDVDLENMHITDANDQSTLEQLMQQDNMAVQEVMPIEGANQKVNTEENDKPLLKVVRTEEDDSDVDLDKLHITDANDRATLEQLMQQDNMAVEEVELVNQEPEEQREQEAETSGEKTGPLLKVVRTEEDDSDINLDSLHITDANDKSTLDQLMQQDNMQVEEIVPVEEDNKQQEPENQREETTGENTGPLLKVVRTEEDDSDVNLDSLHITDANDRATLEQLMQQDNMQVEEIVPVEEDDKEESREYEQGRPIDVVRTEEDDGSDIDWDKYHVSDARDRAVLEDLMQQDNVQVEEVIPVNEEQKQNNKDHGPLLKVVKTVEDDSDVDMEKLHITDANDRATLEQLMQQDNMQVEEIELVDEEEQENQEEQKQDQGNNQPLLKVVRTEEDDSDVDLEKMHITDANDRATLEQLMQQDNMQVEEIELVNQQEPEEKEHEHVEQKQDQSNNQPLLKVVRTEEDDSDVDLEKMHITDANDRSTLEQLMQQDNMQVEEIELVNQQEPEEEEHEQENSKPLLKVMRTEEDDSDVDLEKLHITDANDRATLEQLMQQDNMQVEEIELINKDEQDQNEESNKPLLKVVGTEEDDESDVDLDRMHIDNANDKSTLEQLMAQDNMVVEEVIPVENEQKTDVANEAYKRFNELRNKFRKPKWHRQKSPMVFFSKKTVEEVEEEETTETTFHHPRAASALPMCCTHPVDAGPCKANMMQWYYNPDLRTCVTFTYGGCGGNRNRFDTIGDCLRKCGGITRAAPMPKQAMPGMPQMVDPYKAILGSVTPRIKPFLAIFANMRKEQQPQGMTPPPFPMPAAPALPRPMDAARRPDPSIIRVLINRGRPMPGYEAGISQRHHFDAPPPNQHHDQYEHFNHHEDDHEDDHHDHPMHVFSHRSNSRTFSPTYRKEVVMSPESHDNRFQSHAMPSNKVTLVQVFVNKNRRGGPKNSWDHKDTSFSHEEEDRMPQRFNKDKKPWKKNEKKGWEQRNKGMYSHAEEDRMPHRANKDNKPWKKMMNEKKEFRGRGKSWSGPSKYERDHYNLDMHNHHGPAPNNYEHDHDGLGMHNHHEHDGMGMHSHPRPAPPPMAMPPRFRPQSFKKPWWTRFGRPVTFPEEEENSRFFQTTTYPPDYPKWDSDEVSRPGRVKEITQRQQQQQEQQQEQQVQVVDEQEQPDNEPSYICMLPLDIGPCKALVEKWYFNRETGQCQQFYFGGCRGNANKFETQEECQKICKVAPADQSATTPYPDDVIIVTENVYASDGEYETTPETPEEKETVKEEAEPAVTPDPMAATPVEEEVKEEVKQTEQEAVEGAVAEDVEVEKEDSPSVGRMVLTSEMEYIIIITAMCLVGVIVIILLSFTVAHLVGKCKKSKKERIVEAVVASNPTYSSDFPKLVYYGHTIVPPAPQHDVPDVHTLNKIDLRDEV